MGDEQEKRQVSFPGAKLNSRGTVIDKLLQEHLQEARQLRVTILCGTTCMLLYYNISLTRTFLKKVHNCAGTTLTITVAGGLLKTQCEQCGMNRE